MSAVHIAFEKTSDSLIKKVVKTFAGPYVHAEIVVSTANAHTAYSAYMSELFSRTDNFDFNDEKFDFLALDITPDDVQKISSTCEACVKSKIPYNTRDMVLSQVPFRYPTEADLFHAKTLFCSQAIVLVLRSCLSPEHAICNTLHSVNSRTVSPSQLHTALQPHGVACTGPQIIRRFLNGL